jgi:hypothetical protein
MRQYSTLAAVVAAALALSACGGAGAPPSLPGAASGSPTSASKTGANVPTATEYMHVDADRDNDVHAPADDTNNNAALDFGHEAGEPERRAIVALVRRYYAAGLAGDGTAACSMIYSTLAESVPEDYGSNEPPGPPYMKGTTCPTVLDGLFRHVHSELAAELPLLEVNRVRLVEHHGAVVLGFGRLPGREIPVKREGHTWRLGGLFDHELP